MLQTKTDSLLEELNEGQREVVMATRGPVLVLAGAGSGKTRALTHRIAYLVEQNIARPNEILAVTFTNKAAKEMKERVARLAGESRAKPMAIGTFHGLGVRILREQYRHTKRSAGFTILDAGDSEKLIRQALEKQGLSTKMWSPRQIKHQISRAKNELVSPEVMLTKAAGENEAIAAKTYAVYQQLLAENDGYDFDDLIGETIGLLSAQAQVRDRYRQTWRFLSVDEYQDTNPAQDYLLKLLLNEEKNICVVGDDYQAIYSWRGARVDHILNFESVFPDCRVIYLTRNYRSTNNILTAANAVIAENKEQKHKELWTKTAGGEPVRLIEMPGDREEASFVKNAISRLVDSGAAAGQCAILYRTNAQSRLFEEQFIRYGMPYTIVGGLRFYERAEVKDAMAMLQLTINPRSFLALQRLVKILAAGVGNKTLSRLEEYARANGLPVMAVLGEAEILSDRQRAALTPIYEAWREGRKPGQNNAGEKLQIMLKRSGYYQYLQKLPDKEERAANVEELLNVAAEYKDVASLVEAAALMSDIDEAPETTDRVLCLTLHAAKGLEFDHVFVVGCEEGLLPHRNSFDTPRQIEEERRLMYVGMTRAKKSLVLTRAVYRGVHGELMTQLPSRFLADLPEEVENKEDRDRMMATGDDEEPIYVDNEIGDMVTHAVYGRGVVIEVRGSTVTCVFEGHGVKMITQK
ncbi:MAG: UvrD-helicase domain-containing protein [Candidatus Andersenbacteria bacterium]|nr:UvrD-helicase domain-containing protein [bacterium]MDZ4225660.1 UvrD-helicase domain-containing protein [Candidatus Andersenbacteria bacterium]